MDFDSYEDTAVFTGDIPCYPLDFVQVTPTPCNNTAEEHWYSIRRCFKCKQFYTEAENQDPNSKCNFHPGKYIEPRTITKLVSIGWSCCRSKTNTTYLNANAPGCKQQGKISIFLFNILHYKKKGNN